MQKQSRLLIWLTSGLLSSAFMAPALAAEIDRVTGLITEPGWQQVQANCTACHSSQIILQNSGNREVWQSRIIWMQETQGLQTLDPAIESTILDYLSTNYGPKVATRRAGLPAHLLPDNPYTP